MCKSFTFFKCKDCFIALLIDCANNPVYEELTLEEDYFKNSTDERLHINLRDSKGYTGELERLRRNNINLNLYVTLKSAATKKMKLRVFEFAMGEYIYMLTEKGLTMKQKTYSRVKRNDLAD